ncbi:MAG TPA: hypothetical protein VEP90_15140 [Methylomirabilota bacterium]|jgi:hypothetical protein|nr:hypothetical protein [Methylomirabilota bacterium]
MSSAETIYHPLPKSNILHDGRTTSPIKKIDFLLCNSCFWCASYLNLGTSFIVVQCPLCKENAIEWIPISANDAYSFDYNPVTGVIVEFSNRNKISG